MSGRSFSLDLVAIAVCTLAWGTTWYAITLQLGVVDPVASIVYRFGIAALILFAWAGLRGEPVLLTPPQQRAALAVGLFTFSSQYALVYWAEERIVSAAVAVAFAGHAFVNMILFRLVFAQRAAWSAWLGAAVGVAGVALLSWGEIAGAAFDLRAASGFGLAVAAVVLAALGNVGARFGERAGAPLVASTAWGMVYGVAALALFALATGRAWAFDARPAYVGSLLYLAIVGSVIAFLAYFSLARRRGFSTASYIGAMVPLVAMAVSSLFEAKSWGVSALAGVALVLLGQWLVLRAKSV